MDRDESEFPQIAHEDYQVAMKNFNEVYKKYEDGMLHSGSAIYDPMGRPPGTGGDLGLGELAVGINELLGSFANADV